GTEVPFPPGVPANRCIINLTVSACPDLQGQLQWAKTDVLLMDDFAMAPMPDSARRDLLEILDDRHGRRSTIATSQIPVENWHGALGDPTLADAILDRLVHNTYRINMKGESMRKRKISLTENLLSE
ncbi:DNA replication protein DnaC, partial [Paraburkholderia sp. GAS41]|uniref:ATP-binding protein n=1 Tax=Paraburkholderia sp. GAS41 TaxID=3035134 RepID=UPI003D24E76E